MKKKDLQLELQKVFSYFSMFSYAPTKGEIYMFIEKPMSKKSFSEVLEKMIKKGVIAKKTVENDTKYTVGEYTTGFWESQKSKIQNSKFKIQKIAPYISFLSRFPHIKLIGLSGSVAMMNADRDDDVDLFIITAKGRLWTGRFIAVVLAQLMGIRRKRAKFEGGGVKDKVCLNLFLDEKGLKIRPSKQTKFIAHEVLQMKPLFVRDNVYKRFLETNSWVFKIFPNAFFSISNFLPPLGPVSIKIELPQSRKNSRSSIWSKTQDGIEYLFKKIQLLLINRHRTTETITNTQLWFFPDDFEKKLG